MDIKNYHPFKSEKSKESYLALNDSMSRSWPSPSQCRTVSTSYGNTFVRINGPVDGPPLVLLAGALSCSLQWLPNIESLSKKFRTYTVDSLINTGCVGRSIYSKLIEEKKDAIEWLDELFTALGLNENIHLAGMSYGGWLVSHYAIQFPEKTGRLVLLAPAIMSMSWQFILRAIPTLFNPSYKSVKGFLDWHLDIDTTADRKAVEEFINLITISKLSFEDTKYPMFSKLEDNELQSIKAPTCLLVGDKDRSYSVKKGIKKIRKAVPHWKIDVLPHVGHSLPIGHAEAVNRKILDFLNL